MNFKADITLETLVSKEGSSYPDKENVKDETQTKKKEWKKKENLSATTKPSAALEYVRKLRKENETKVEKRSGMELFLFKQGNQVNVLKINRYLSF